MELSNPLDKQKSQVYSKGSMKKFFGFLTVFFVLTLIVFGFPQQSSAAEVRAGDHISLTQNEKHLKDLYLFGSNIIVDAPVKNDLVTAGGDISINGPVSNDLLIGGGNITVKGTVGNTARIGGGNITIDSPIKNDLVIGGGNVTITKNASIGGDLLVAGGKVDVQGTVHGKILTAGGDITINNAVGGNVTVEHVKQLILGPQASIAGSLIYTSAQKVQQSPSSFVAGKTTFHMQEPKQRENVPAQFLAGMGLYKLIIDIIITLLFIYFFRQGLEKLMQRMKKEPVKSGAYGFAFVLLAPLASFIMLILLWLGLASFLFVGLVWLISLFIVKVFIGWFVIALWNKQQKQHAYVLDWKAGIVGPIVLFIILLIPVLGWLMGAILFFIAVGAFSWSLVDLMPHLQGAKKGTSL